MKPCEQRSKKDLIQTCKDDRNITVGLGKLGKEELVDLCCSPDGPRSYLEKVVKEPSLSLARNTLAGDIVMSMDRVDAPFIREIVKQQPAAPSKDFWQSLKRYYGITKGNLQTGNPVDCSIPIPPAVKSATLLATSGRDVFDNKAEIKEKLGGTYLASLSSAWVWPVDRCDDLASQNLLLDDVRIKPCTVVVIPRESETVAKKAASMVKDDMIMGPWGPTETADEAAKRSMKWRADIKDKFNVDPTPENVKMLAMDPHAMKFFHEAFGTFPMWTCENPGLVNELMQKGKGIILPREKIPHDEHDITSEYLARQRDILPDVVVTDHDSWIEHARASTGS